MRRNLASILGAACGRGVEHAMLAIRHKIAGKTRYGPFSPGLAIAHKNPEFLLPCLWPTLLRRNFAPCWAFVWHTAAAAESNFALQPLRWIEFDQI